ncbi:amino acid ABC transporter [Arsukibacterium sp.]|uniref:amino acid ABC transporter n=1 Tax=Arsukibacterium sp. TaxID=1977258 RepID=UPI002FDB67BE
MSSSIAMAAPQRQDNSAIILRFCYEDKQLLPYYAGNTSEIPSEPGATIEHLQAATAAVGINLKLQRLPWLRCLQLLESNETDALVAAYSPERAHYTIYPKDTSGQPDTGRAINRNALCLLHRHDNDLSSKLAEDKTVTLARPVGYRLLPLTLNNIQVDVFSIQQAMELVVLGRVDATTSLCEINGVPAHPKELDLMPVVLLRPPIYHAIGYLMFSQQFYQQYPEQAEALWQALPKTLDSARYLEYLSYPW